MLIKELTSFKDYTDLISEYKYAIIYITSPSCMPCKIIQPQITKFIKVIESTNVVYLTLDVNLYESEFDSFDPIFNLTKFPYFGFLYNEKLLDSLVSSDFREVSMNIFDFVKWSSSEIPPSDNSVPPLDENIVSTTDK
jgi:hypothetical protein